MKTILSLCILFSFLFTMDRAFPYEDPVDSQKIEQSVYTQAELYCAAPAPTFADQHYHDISEASEIDYRMSADIKESQDVIIHDINCPYHPKNLDGSKEPLSESGKLIVNQSTDKNSLCSNCHSTNNKPDFISPHISEQRSRAAFERMKDADRRMPNPSLYEDKDWLKRQKEKADAGHRP